MEWSWFEGSRSFDLAWGAATGALCVALAIPTLWWAVGPYRRRLFGAGVDPHQRLQLAYGIFCLAMAFTNVGCRTIPHGELAFVHPTFFLITLALIAALGPRIVRLSRSP